MKNVLLSIRSEQGFSFPLLLLVFSFLLLFFHASLLQLQTSQSLTVNEKEQLHLETLFRMANEAFQNEETYTQEDGQESYSFPYGTVSVQYSMIDDYLQTQFTMVTDQGSKRVVKRRIYLDP